MLYLFKHNIDLTNLSNQEIYYDDLSNKNSLNISNCIDTHFFIDCKINKIIIKNCNNIFIYCKELISGIEIENSYITIFPLNENNIYLLDCYKTNCNLIINNINKLYNFNIISYNSHLFFYRLM